MIKNMRELCNLYLDILSLQMTKRQPRKLPTMISSNLSVSPYKEISMIHKVL
jgi:hypothetical protein